MRPLPIILSSIAIVLMGAGYFYTGKKTFPNQKKQTPFFWNLAQDSVHYYDIKYHSSGKSNVESLSSLNMQSNSATQARWEKVSTELEGRIAIFPLGRSVEDPSCQTLNINWTKIHAHIQSSNATLFKTERRKPAFNFKTELCEDGRIRHLAFHRKSNALVRNLNRLVLDSMSVYFTKSQTINWNVSESSVLGDFDHQYRLVGSKEDSNSVEIVKSASYKTAELEVSKNCQIEFSVDRNLILKIENEGVVKHFLNSRLVGEEKFLTRVDFRESINKSELHSSQPNHVEIAQLQKYGKKVPNISFQEELQLLEDQRQKKLTEDADLSLILEKLMDGNLSDRERLTIQAFLQQEPNSATILANHLSILPVDSKPFHQLSRYLANAGTSEAQASLIEVMKGRESETEVLKNLIPYLASSKQPTGKMETYLWELTDQDARPEIHGTAALGLGTLGYEVKKSDPSRAKAIQVEFSKRLKSAISSKEKGRYIRVLGNIGGKGITQDLQNHLSEGSEYRTLALDALRNGEEAEVSPLLIEAITKPGNEEIKFRALQALAGKDRSDSAITFYQEVLVTEKNTLLVKQVLLNLGRVSEDSERALKIVKEFRKSCGNQELCSLAQKILLANG